MCLYIKSGEHTAKRSFFTFKLVEDISSRNYRSFYMQTIHYFGTTYHVDIKKTTLANGIEKIDDGFHSIFMPHGFDVGSNYDNFRFDDFPGIAIILCQILSGTKYYIGYDMDIVSNMLLPIEPLIVSRGSAITLEHNLGYVNTVSNALRYAYDIAKKNKLRLSP